MPEQSNEELCALIRQGDEQAREQLIRQNRGFVYQTVLSILSGRNSAVKDDMVQEGHLALLHAAERFDPARGVKLLSYAGAFIEGAARAVLRAELAQQEHRAPLQAAGQLTVTDIWSVSVDPYRLPPEPYVIRRETIQRALKFIEDNLSALQLDILQRWYGLGDEVPQSMEEIAVSLCRTPASVRSARDKALEKLAYTPGGASFI